MPVFAKVTPDSAAWHFETSATAGFQAPLRSINVERLSEAAICLGRALLASSSEKYAWVNFCRWTPNAEYGVEEHTDETYQLAFTRHGIAMLKNWESVYAADNVPPQHVPVLIYEYDASCILFCDVVNFFPEDQTWHFLSAVLGFEKRAHLSIPTPGHFSNIKSYMESFSFRSDGVGIQLPEFAN